MKVLVSTRLRPARNTEFAEADTYSATHLEAVERVICYMRKYSHEPLELARLATVAGISKYHFIRVFTAVTGITPMSFLTSLRLEQAKKLLLHSPATVTDICQEVGYSSIGSFSDSFTRLVGISPSRYRDNSQKFDTDTPFQSTLALGLSQTDGSLLHGRIIAPDQPPGTYLVGLFPTGLMAGFPLAGECMSEAGEFILPMPESDSFYLIALYLPQSAASPAAHRHSPRHLIARRQICKTRMNPDSVINLVLRVPLLSDPPLVLALDMHQLEATRSVA